MSMVTALHPNLSNVFAITPVPEKNSNITGEEPVDNDARALFTGWSSRWSVLFSVMISSPPWKELSLLRIETIE
jgi:ABC-type Fe3+-hydroxamate transport system substrate-binding protein